MEKPSNMHQIIPLLTFELWNKRQCTMALSSTFMQIDNSILGNTTPLQVLVQLVRRPSALDYGPGQLQTDMAVGASGRLLVAGTDQSL